MRESRVVRGCLEVVRVMPRHCTCTHLVNGDTINLDTVFEKINFNLGNRGGNDFVIINNFVLFKKEGPCIWYLEHSLDRRSEIRNDKTLGSA